jgi:hypothetical protein
MSASGIAVERVQRLSNVWTAVLQAVDASRKAPLSARHALAAAVQIDQFSDHAFAARAALSEPNIALAADILAFRAALRAQSVAVGCLMDLSAAAAQGPYLEVIASALAPEAYAKLAVADLMVSLYNAGAVPQLMLVQSEGAALPILELLQAAIDWWSITLGTAARA